MVTDLTLDPHGYVNETQRSEVLIMRHPQTVANAEHRYLGCRNASLTPLGEEQKKRAIEGIVAYAPTRIVSSPLDRCLAVADPAAQRLQVELIVDERIRELDFGALEGLTHDEGVAAGLCFPWGETAPAWPCQDAEPIDAFARRTMDAAHSLARYSGKTAVLAHGGVTRAIVAFWLHIPAEHLWTMTVKNVQSALFSFDEEHRAFLERFGLEPEWLNATM